MQFFPASLLPSAINDLYAEVYESGQLKLGDRLVIRTAIIGNFLSEEDLLLLDRIIYSVRRGRLKLVNEL